MRPGIAFVLAAAYASFGTLGRHTQPPKFCEAGLGSNRDLPIPTLAPGPGMLATRWASSYHGRESFRCTVRYDAATSAVAIADHVGSQMVALGWTPAEREVDASFAASRYTATSTLRVPLSAVTFALAIDGTPYYDASVHIVRHQAIAPLWPGFPPLIGRAGGGGAWARGDEAALTATLDGLLRTALPVLGGGAYVEGRSLPPGFPAEILPRGTDIRLSATSDLHSTVVGVAPSLTIFEIPLHFVSLRKSGWIGLAPDRGLSPGASPQPADLCRGTETGRMDFIPLPSGGLAIRARHSRTSVPCQPPSILADSFADVAVPILSLTGFLANEMSGGYGSGRFDSEMHGRTANDASTIAKELASQLVRAGWTLTAQLRVGPVTVVRARSTSAAADPVTALLFITPLSESSRMNLWLHMVRHKYF